jgi:hypothetical protein
MKCRRIGERGVREGGYVEWSKQKKKNRLGCVGGIVEAWKCEGSGVDEGVGVGKGVDERSVCT